MITWIKNLFHSHSFDPDTWVLAMKITVVGNYDEIIQYKHVYTNTCKQCGFLEEKIVRS